MVGYFSVIVPVHLLAALLLITPTPGVNATISTLKCHTSTNQCDKDTCAESEAATSSETLDSFNCKTLFHGVGYTVQLVGEAISKELTNEDFNRVGKEIQSVHSVLAEKLAESDKARASTDVLCSRIAVTGTVKVPGKTIQKTVVTRGCSYTEHNCVDFKSTSDSGNVETTVLFCARDGDDSNSEGRHLVASKVLLLAPFILMGITAFLAVPSTPN